MIFSRIIGTGSYLPPRVVTNHDLARQMETSDEWIVARTGIRQRHLAEEGQGASDMAFPASLAAMEAAKIKADEIDLIIVATSTPDMAFPSTACLLQKKLGNKGAIAFDLQAVCSGFVYALTTADHFIRAGQAKCALVVGAEVFSRLIDWSDRTTSVLFGDGAGAVVLRAADTPGILASALHADGSYSDILSAPGNICGGKILGNPFVVMDGQSVFKFAVRVLDEVGRETLSKANLSMSDVDWLIPHQANVRILEATAKKLGIPTDKVVVTVDRHANTSGASIPLALDAAVRDGRVKPGHRLLLLGVGGGFTWGGVLLQI
ncbi:MAG TPA: beta-ketoacyl-ACP synthase III [Burkholderiales bacterium]|nr:beta-ketoacyl-ACP synthase III [Burkholderiales bacterium]